MTKERFLSIFEAYEIRTRGCKQKTAKDYKDYLRYINSRAMDMLRYPDYLEWISECSSYDRIKNYIQLLAESIGSISTKKHEISNWETAIKILDEFIDEIFRKNNIWPQFGDDKEIKLIKYREGTDKNIQVADLCVDLKNEYIRVVDLAKHIFGDLFENNVYEYIPVVLNPDKRVDECQATEEYMEKLYRRRERQDLTQEENETLRDRTIRYRVLAMFHSGKEPKIELFYRNTEANNREEYLSILKNALAHEYMHYLHYCYCDKISNKDTFKDGSISEGVAEFFAMLFTLYRDGASDWLFAEKKYWIWAKMFGSGWTYADALYLYKARGKEYFHTERIWDFEDNGCIEKLVDVLRNGADFAKAYTTFKS